MGSAPKRIFLIKFTSEKAIFEFASWWLGGEGGGVPGPLWRWWWFYHYIMFKRLCLNPFQCGSLGCAHHMAWGPKSPDKIGLFGPFAAWREYPSSQMWANCYSLYGNVNCWESCFLTLSIPPDNLCCHTEPRKNRVQYLHSYSVLGMKTSFYEKVY